MTEMKPLTPLREYKARLFVMLFNDRERLLELYNAVSGRDYRDPGSLTINTLENAIYLSMKNDISFLIDFRLSLYEHQSTYNPNMPLRFLFYLADLYSAMTQGKNRYGVTRISLPTPEFVVFYNGEDEQPDRQELRLSDSYEIMDAERAITECIQEGILREFLEKNRSEARAVSIYEYNEEEHMRMEREEFFEKGRLAEQENTERERKRAEVEKMRADAAEAELERLRAELRKVK